MVQSANREDSEGNYNSSFYVIIITTIILSKDNRQPLSSPDTSLADIQPLTSTTVVSVSPSDMTDAAEATDVIDDMSDVSSPDFSPATSSISSELPETDTTESDDNIASSSSRNKLPTFKVVGDNVDKSVRQREETSESFTVPSLLSQLCGTRQM